MAKIVYNACYGGFGLSHKATMRYATLKGIKLYPFVPALDVAGNRNYGQYVRATEETLNETLIVTYFTTPEQDDDAYYYLGHMEEDRSDPILIRVVEELGKEANGECADLRIEEIPNGTLYRIDEYDGFEKVMTQSDYRWNVAT